MISRCLDNTTSTIDTVIPNVDPPPNVYYIIEDGFWNTVARFSTPYNVMIRMFFHVRSKNPRTLFRRENWFFFVLRSAWFNRVIEYPAAFRTTVRRVKIQIFARLTGLKREGWTVLKNHHRARRPRRRQ